MNLASFIAVIFIITTCSPRKNCGIGLVKEISPSRTSDNDFLQNKIVFIVYLYAEKEKLVFLTFLHSIKL